MPWQRWRWPSVDLALKLAGDLPSQQAKADLVKQDIEEIGNRLKDASEARGDAADGEIGPVD